MTHKESKDLSTLIFGVLLTLTVIAVVYFETASTTPRWTYSFVQNSPIVLGIVGALIGAVCRALSKRPNDMPTLTILLRDYHFDKYATISLLTFVYAITQGAGIGVAAALVINIVVTQQFYPAILAPLFILLGVVGARITIESYIIVYRLGQDLLDELRSRRN